MKCVTHPPSLLELRDAVLTNGSGGIPVDRYLDLVREFPLRPLRDDAHYRHAIAVLDRLFESGPLTSSDERDYFKVLALLAWDYESRTAPAPASPALLADACD